MIGCHAIYYTCINQYEKQEATDFNKGENKLYSFKPFPTYDKSAADDFENLYNYRNNY